MNASEFELRALTARRKSKLEWYEREIEKRTGSLVAIFRELREDGSKPYLATHENFEHYCEDRWGMSPRRIQQLVAADTVRAQLADAAPDLAPTVASMKEGVIRELATVEPSARPSLLRRTIEQPGKNTAAKIRAVKGRTIDAATGKPDPAPRCCPTCRRPLP